MSAGAVTQRIPLSFHTGCGALSPLSAAAFTKVHLSGLTVTPQTNNGNKIIIVIIIMAD